METSLYRFVGAVSEIGRKTLERLGTKISLSDAEALNAIDGGCQLCPAADFPFSDEECKKYSTSKFRDRAPEEFKARLKQAYLAVAAHLEVLKAKAKAEAEAETPAEPAPKADPTEDSHE